MTDTDSLTMSQLIKRVKSNPVYRTEAGYWDSAEVEKLLRKIDLHVLYVKAGLDEADPVYKFALDVLTNGKS